MATQATSIHYSCIGPVRGECGVRHRSLQAAEEHCVSDHRAMQAPPGGDSSSDRQVWKVNGEGLYHRPDPMILGRFAEVGIPYSDVTGR